MEPCQPQSVVGGGGHWRLQKQQRQGPQSLIPKGLGVAGDDSEVRRSCLGDCADHVLRGRMSLFTESSRRAAARNTGALFFSYDIIYSETLISGGLGCVKPSQRRCFRISRADPLSNCMFAAKTCGHDGGSMHSTPPPFPVDIVTDHWVFLRAVSLSGLGRTFSLSALQYGLNTIRNSRPVRWLRSHRYSFGSVFFSFLLFRSTDPAA